MSSGVDDAVGVPLLGEEPLTVLGEVGIDGVAGDDGVEVGRTAVLLRPQDPAQPLGLLLTRPEGAADLDGDAGLGQVDGEVRHLADDQYTRVTVAEARKEPFALSNRCRSGDDRRVEVLSELGELIRDTGR